MTESLKWAITFDVCKDVCIGRVFGQKTDLGREVVCIMVIKSKMQT